MEPADPGTLLALMEALEASRLGTLARTSTWVYPLASVLHVLGLAFLLGTIAVLDLRVLGAAKRLPLDACLDFLPTIAGCAVAVQVVTGLVMFAADADHVYDNPYFLAKLALIAVALANVALFRVMLRRDPATRHDLDAPPWAKASAAVSLAAWIGVASFGRMIAYI
jgi:hypothetical protein